ncbi:ribosomal protein S6 [Rubidibacter lacunae KORDI 51-2]|uniref:Small ribosomal subunit protein bS6 n=1 Tax=Rubidibacter lacunae KORDI 51-2 TaxID=582515 RepID=U5DJX2_9CHRO|nr:30S ribosomal protein S6 [Rubidibacter lacunae]ERN41202.1 ribosomal protein S6 [Rubidibacter lacunae KORDI 51-2]
MIQSYETMYILRPDLAEERVGNQILKYRELLESYGATAMEIQNRGKRRLAYPIQKFQDGIYVQMNFDVTGEAIAPMERAMRLSEEVMRFMTLLSPRPKESAPVEA